jgi:hypothetical protein
VANLAITFGTVPIDFIPSRLTLLLGVAYGASCAAYLVGAAGYAHKRHAQLTDSQRARFGASLAKPSIVIIAVLQLGMGTAAFINGIGGVSTWLFGQPAEVRYTVRETTWLSHRSATRLFGGASPCSGYEFRELTAWQNDFIPCLDEEFQPGSRLLFRGFRSPLGLKFISVDAQSGGGAKFALLTTAAPVPSRLPGIPAALPRAGASATAASTAGRSCASSQECTG